MVKKSAKKNFETQKNFMGFKNLRKIQKKFFKKFQNYQDPTIFGVSKIFFLLISAPKRIELNSEFRSRWVLGLGQNQNPKHKHKFSISDPFRIYIEFMKFEKI